MWGGTISLSSLIVLISYPSSHNDCLYVVLVSAKIRVIRTETVELLNNFCHVLSQKALVTSHYYAALIPWYKGFRISCSVSNYIASVSRVVMCVQCCEHRWVSCRWECVVRCRSFESPKVCDVILIWRHTTVHCLMCVRVHISVQELGLLLVTVETARRDALIDKYISGPSIRTIFADSIFYCPVRATCFGFLRKSLSGIGIKM
jgi:hypothetical protein